MPTLHEITSSQELHDQLRQLVDDLHTRVREVFGHNIELPSPARVVDVYLLRLQESAGTADALSMVTGEMMFYLVPKEAMDDISFWATPLGQVFAMTWGYHLDTVPQYVAAGVAGISRQGINDALKRGALEDVGPNVTRESLARFIRNRAAR